MTGASEWHRAGLAVSGVTLVLLIAAGIYFIAPPRSDRTASSPAITATTPPVTTAASTEGSPATAEPAPTTRELPPSPRGQRAPSHLARAPVGEGAAANELPPSGAERVFATPLAASVEIPEQSVLLEPVHMPVNAEFVEPMLPAMPSGDAGARDVSAPATRQRDPVTAAFVTAGSAVAGGFRSAGRALKRAF